MQFGLTVTPGGLVHPLHRAARQAAPTYTALRDNVQQSAIVTPDETGWRVGGELRWLWVAAHALRLRDRHLAGEVSEHGLAVARGRLQTRLNAVLDQPSTVPAVRRFATHLNREWSRSSASCTIPPSRRPTGEPSKRFAPRSVANGKVCGGNRTSKAAQTLDPLRVIGDLLRERVPRIAAALFPTDRPTSFLAADSNPGLVSPTVIVSQARTR